MSASATEVVARCGACGASAFVPKPIEHGLLLLTIGRLMDLDWLYEPSGPSASMSLGEAARA